LFFWKPFKFHRFNLNSPHCILMVVTLGACIFFIKCSFSIKFCWVLFSLKSSYCDKIFMSIQVVLNVWSNLKFKIHTFLHYNELRWLYNFFIQGLFSIIFVGKFVHTSLVFVVKISYQSKKLWVTDKHFRRRFSHRCDFLLFLSLFFDISKPFCKHNESIEWYFLSSMFLYASLEAVFSSKFFHLSRFRVQISPPNVFLGKFQHLFPTLKYYNPPTYVGKWPQIWFMSSRTCTLQDCMVEIFIPYWHLDL